MVVVVVASVCLDSMRSVAFLLCVCTCSWLANAQLDAIKDGLGILGDDAEWVAKDAGLVFSATQLAGSGAGLGTAIVRALMQGDSAFGTEIAIVQTGEYELLFTACATSGACLPLWGAIAAVEVYCSLMSTWSNIHHAEEQLSTDLLALRNDLVNMLSDVKDIRKNLVQALQHKPPLLGNLVSSVDDMLALQKQFCDDASDAIHEAEVANDNRWDLWCDTLGWGCLPEVPPTVISKLGIMKRHMGSIGGKLHGMKDCAKLVCAATEWAQLLGDTTTCLNGVCWNLRDAMTSWSDAGGDIPKSSAPQCTSQPIDMASTIDNAAPPIVLATNRSAKLSTVIESFQEIKAEASKKHKSFGWGAALAGLVAVLFFFKGIWYLSVMEGNMHEAYIPLSGGRGSDHTPAQATRNKALICFFLAVSSACACTWCNMKMLSTSQMDILAGDISVPLGLMPERVRKLTDLMPHEGYEHDMWNALMDDLDLSLWRLSKHTKEL